MENDAKEKPKGESLSVLDYEPKEKSFLQKWKDGHVTYEVIPNGEKCEETAKAKLRWNLEQGIWIAKVEGYYMVGYERGTKLTLPFSHNPCCLNDSAARKLLEAYRVPEDRIKLDDVATTNPSDLEKLAETSSQ